MNKPIEHSEGLIVIVGPSGAGKDTVLQAWAALRAPNDRVHLARRTLTRPHDEGAEQHEGVDAGTFIELQKAGAFATTWQAHGLHYGVRHRALAPLATGWVLLNSSRAHLAHLRAQAPRMAVVEITAPTAVLAQRLAERGREDLAAVVGRLQRRTPAVHADLTLVNDSSLAEVAQALQRWWQARQHAP